MCAYLCCVTLDCEHMKRRTIWAIAVVMGACFLALIYLQVRYVENVEQMRREQFDGAVQRALYRAAYHLELKDTQQELKRVLIDSEVGQGESRAADSTELARSFDLLMESRRRTASSSAAGRKVWRGEVTVDAAAERLRTSVRERFVHGQQLVNEVVYNLLYEAGERPLSKRMDCEAFDNDVRRQLKYGGIELPYHIRVTTGDGREIYRCADYSEKGGEMEYRQVLFPNASRQQIGVVAIHFPEMERYIFAGVKFMLPAIVFTIVLLVVFIFTIYTIFRQKRLSEIKHDFINNMTHEFKTPLSSISLAAQMLSDEKVVKQAADPMIAHLSGVIVQETKRMRFQVEKVLQISLLEDRADTFKFKEVDLHALVDEVVAVFRLKVEAGGGEIATNLAAERHTVCADRMHLTNVLFNLMDNAVKYKHPDRKLRLTVTTHDKGGFILLAVGDNGIGIRREQLKSIFEKFYRVEHGNVHNVKGFGLGLAYVRNVVGQHKGTIRAESDFGEGSRFIIQLPVEKKH